MKTLCAVTQTGTFPYKSRLQWFEQVMLMEQLSDLLNMNVEESMGKRPANSESNGGHYFRNSTVFHFFQS